MEVLSGSKEVRDPIMVATGYDREGEVQAFEDTKAGVKGLVDGGTTKVPRMFIDPDQIRLEKETYPVTTDPEYCIPVIDFEDIDSDTSRRREVIEQVKNASAKWGFFQVVNHCIPVSVMNKMIEGTGGFHEQGSDAKKEFYTRDMRQTVVYNSNMDLFQSSAAYWKDAFQCHMFPKPHYEALPAVCRDIMIEYSSMGMKLGITLFELLSEALGLEPNYLKDEGCTETLMFGGHYYPACPEPELTMGLRNHTDVGFFTLLIQDQLGGLQVLHRNKWVEVDPLPGAVIVGISELLQLMSNDKFKSTNHRVIAQNTGPRVSASLSYHPNVISADPKPFKPIEELLSEDNPPRYKAVTMREYIMGRFAGRYGKHSLSPFMFHESPDRDNVN